MKKSVWALLTGVMISGAMSAGAFVATAKTYAITNARLLMVGDAEAPRTIPNGTLLIRNGRIVDIGTSVAIPDGITPIDAGGQPVTPGLFAPMSALGLEEISLDRESNDRSLRGDVGIVAAMDAADGFYADSTVIAINRAGGVTRAVSALDPGDKLFSGCAAIVDLSGGPNPITRECVATIAALGYSGARSIGDSRPAAVSTFRAILEDVKAFSEDPFQYRRTADPRRLTARDAQALVPVLNGDRKLLIYVNGASDIRRTLDLAEEYGLDIVLLGAAEAWRVADDLVAAEVPVVLDPVANLPSDFETFGSSLNAAGILAKAGVQVAFFDNDIGYTHNIRVLTQLAGNAVANGMSYDDALAAITAVPATIYGLGNRLGTLEIGKVADVVIWDGDPLEVTSRPTHVFIGGQQEPLDSRQDALVRRYRDLSRGDLPFSYLGE